MKKTLFFICILLCVSTHVRALTIEYSPNYYIEGENPIEYSMKAEDHNSTTEFSNWSTNVVEAKPNRVIEERYVTKHRKTKPIRYLHLNHFVSESNYFEFAEFDIFIDDDEIPYQIIKCDHCNSAFFEYATDGNTLLNYCSVYTLGNIVIDLGNYYSIEELKFDFYMFDTSLNPKSFDVYASDSPILDSNSFYKKIMIYTINKSTIWEMYRYRVVPDESWLNGNESLFSNFIYGEIDEEETYYFDIYRGYEYRYYDVLYQYYREIEDSILISETKEEEIVEGSNSGDTSPFFFAPVTRESSTSISTREVDEATIVSLQSNNAVDEKILDTNTKQVVVEVSNLTTSADITMEQKDRNGFDNIALCIAAMAIIVGIIKKLRNMSHKYKH